VSRHAFDPLCPDCRPVILDPKTGRVLPSDDPVMKAVNQVWDAASREEQESFHRVTVHNGRDPMDLARLKALSERIAQAAEAN
jgi:hypothetical protein